MLLVLLKKFYNVWLPIHHPFCHKCGHAVEEFIVEEQARKRVTNGALELLCFRCFYTLARIRGVRGVWRVSAPEREWPMSEL